jgi:antitoxin YefM
MDGEETGEGQPPVGEGDQDIGLGGVEDEEFEHDNAAQIQAVIGDELKAACDEPNTLYRGGSQTDHQLADTGNGVSFRDSLSNPVDGRYTKGMSKTVPVRELRSELSQFIDQVADLREHVIVTRRGRPAAVLVPVDEYEALEETAEILSDTDALTAIEEGREEIELGETVTLDELRRELDRRHS